MAAPKKTDKGSVDVTALQAEIDTLRAQLAAASSTASTALAQFETEKSALMTELDQSKANLAQVSARLEHSIEERAKLSTALEHAHSELQKHGAAPPKVAPPVINGPSISVKTRPGRQQTRYRAGRAFGPEATPIALADLTEDQLVEIRGDTELVVTDAD